MSDLVLFGDEKCGEGVKDRWWWWKGEGVCGKWERG
jgi:hypothetical protein